MQKHAVLNKLAMGGAPYRSGRVSLAGCVDMLQPVSTPQGAVCISGIGKTLRAPCSAGRRRTRHEAGGRAALPGRRQRPRLAAQAGLPLQLAAEEGRGGVAAAHGRAPRRQRAPHEDVAALAAPAAGRPTARSGRPCSGRRLCRPGPSRFGVSGHRRRQA